MPTVAQIVETSSVTHTDLYVIPDGFDGRDRDRLDFDAIEAQFILRILMD